MFDFPFAASLAIYNKSPGRRYTNKFSPASINFNKSYSVSCDDEMTAASFLKPTIVLKFEEMLSQLSEINFEVSSNGRACLSFKDDLVCLNRKHGVEEPERFKQEIAQNRELKKLNSVLEFAHYLMTKSDNNFESGR